MSIDEFLNLLRNRKLSGSQLTNLQKIAEISRRFHREAKIPLPETRINNNSIVLESGHQPNYLPHPGTWKKAFLLNLLQQKLEDSIALFGFADYNLCTASILYSNKIPALTRDGCVKIGFSIPKKDRWKTFDSIPKPSEEEFENEINHLRSTYRNSSNLAKLPFSEIEPNLREIEEIMWQSYELAGNFPDMNAFIFSNICSKLGLNIHFFRYTDIQKERIFMDEWKTIIENLNSYNKTYNQILEEGKFPGIAPLKEDSFPFWYRCNCGGNMALSIKESKATGRCPICKKTSEISIENLESHFPRMSMTAVARNLILSNGLGTSLYISGSGGGLRYGEIANRISDSLNLHKPITLTWLSRDYYLGLAHIIALNNLTKTFNLTPNNLLDSEKLISGVKNRRDSLLKKIEELENQNADGKEIQRFRGRYTNMETQTKITKKVFETIPSAIDLFFSVGIKEIHESWKNAIVDSEIQRENHFYKIRGDINYPSELIEREKIPLIYDSIASLPE